MEQTVNQFNKCLQMDTHPMVQSPDTLTDALNATFVTMNGNEVILQNDMGNRRVDNAYLPPGYEPVGIKEYGGVIYIAAYNPITNHSQIGSFPSPERKIDYNDDNSLKSDFDFENFVSTVGGNIVEDSELKIPVMINDSFLIPLTKTNTLHVGDKFVVYAPDLSKMKDDISNYDNIDSESDKVYSPKNRKYTIQIGVLNEQNNFNDITKYLVRWDDESPANIIKDLGNKSDLYKFNKGYFIPDGFTYQTDIEGNTIDDTNLILSRKQIVANTFSYKLAGPLYLRVEYNHVSNFGFRYTGRKNSDGNIELTIEGYFTYNCPDGVITGDLVADSDYYTYALGVENLSTNYLDFDFYNDNGNTVSIKSPIGASEIFSSHTYDKITNKYKVTLTKKYDLEYDENNPIFKYIIGVKGGVSENNSNFYIKELSSKGEINLSLLNSGELNFRQYKFYNNATSQDTTMLLNFESYPKAGENFENLYLTFKNINPNDISDSGLHYLYTKQPILNGQQIINFNWEKSFVDLNGNEYPLQLRKTYEIEIHYTKKTENGNIDKIYEENIVRWFLTTELFNDLYSTNISDFCTTQDKRFIDKITIQPNIEDLKGIYDVTYSDVTFYDPRDINVDTNVIPLYRIERRTQDSITLYQIVNISKSQSTKELDVSLYPDYIETIYLNINETQSGDETIVNSETIEMQSYEPLNTIYYPLRTINQYKDKVKITLCVEAYADDDGDWDDDAGYILWHLDRARYDSLSENWVEEDNTFHDRYPGDWGMSSYYEVRVGENNHCEETFDTYEKLEKSNITLKDYYNFYFICYFNADHAGGDFNGSDGGGRIGGPYYAMELYNDSSKIGFVKNINTANSFIINWNELSTSGSTVYKIIGNNPTIHEQFKTLNYEVTLDSEWTNIRKENLNLVFNIKETDIDPTTQYEIPYSFTQNISYHNRDIVETYIHYKLRNTDKWINMNTGQKILDNTKYQQQNTTFNIKNCQTIQLKGSSRKEVARADDDNGWTNLYAYVNKNG